MDKTFFVFLELYLWNVFRYLRVWWSIVIVARMGWVLVIMMITVGDGSNWNDPTLCWSQLPPGWYRVLISNHQLHHHLSGRVTFVTCHVSRSTPRRPSLQRWFRMIKIIFQFVSLIFKLCLLKISRLPFGMEEECFISNYVNSGAGLTANVCCGLAGAVYQHINSTLGGREILFWLASYL